MDCPHNHDDEFVLRCRQCFQKDSYCDADLDTGCDVSGARTLFVRCYTCDYPIRVGLEEFLQRFSRKELDEMSSKEEDECFERFKKYIGDREFEREQHDARRAEADVEVEQKLSFFQKTRRYLSFKTAVWFFCMAAAAFVCLTVQQCFK